MIKNYLKITYKNLHITKVCLTVKSLGLLLLFNPSIYGQANLEKSIGTFVNPFLQNKEFDGYVLVSQKGELKISKSFSIDNESFDVRTPFMIGSITKTFTAEAIMSLIDQDKISLNTKLADYLPSIPSANKITIRHLLTHQSGVPDYYSIDEFNELRNTEMSLEGFSKWISKFPLDFEPGKSNSYSNSGYNLLAYIVEKITGETFANHLKNGIFSSLKVSGAGSVENGIAVDIPKGFEPAHYPELLNDPEPIDPSWLIGSGSIYATTQDLLRWGEEVKKRLTTDAKWKPYGWGIRERNKEQYLEQNGRIPGFASNVRIFPKSDLIVIVLGRIESDAVNAVTDGITELSFGNSPGIPKVRKLMQLSRDVFLEYDGVYEITPTFFVTISAEESGLGISTGRGSNLTFAALDALGDDKFFFRVGYSDVRFEKGKDGNVSGLYWGTSGLFPKVK